MYNTAGYVEEAIESIRQQTLKELEIIVINDGSTDQSPVILKRIAQEEPRISLYTQSNQGLSVTRNIGMERATGEFIYFFDSDDLLEPEALENCYRTAVHDGTDLLFFDALHVNECNQAIATPLSYRKASLFQGGCYEGDALLPRLIEKQCFSPSVCLTFIRREFLCRHRLKFYPGILHEDQLFSTLLYALAGRISYLPHTYFRRRVRANSITTSRFSMRNVEGYITVCQELIRCRKELSHLLHPAAFVDAQVRTLVNTTASSSITLGFRQRMQVLGKLLHFRGRLSPKSVLLLFFPFLKRNRKHPI